jgi:membrane protein YqaA with SNARE-associated domain
MRKRKAPPKRDLTSNRTGLLLVLLPRLVLLATLLATLAGLLGLLTRLVLLAALLAALVRVALVLLPALILVRHL